MPKKRVTAENSLASLNPRLAAQWHPSLNGTLTPQGVTANSGQKVWWRCAQGHDFNATIDNRSPPRSSGCPYCAGKKANAENCLAARYPDLAQQWHPTLNGTLTPQDVTANSGKKVWWRCPRGHEHKATIDNRTPPKSNKCPYCVGKKVNNENCLATQYPALAAQWHPRLNGTLTAYEVTPGSNKKIWWSCPKGHDYQAVIRSRIPPQSSGCPYCVGKKVNNENCLATQHPALAAEWHPTLNGSLTPWKVTPGSHIKAWWYCSKGHHYEAEIANRAKSKPTGCPYCAGKKKTAPKLADLHPLRHIRWLNP